MAATAESQSSQALEKVAPKTPEQIKTPEEFRKALMRWQEQKLNVLTPFTNMSGLAPSHVLMSSAILLSTTPEVGEVYTGLPFLKKDEYALTKKALRKLAECAGVSTSVKRTDGRAIRDFWEVEATASYRGVDGSIIVRQATMEWDLRDGSPRLKGWSQSQIEEGRKHGLRNCEARAINAAIRECGCGIKQKYTRQELEKPFAIVKVAFVADMSDPDIKRIVTERALGGTTALYALPQAALPSHDGPSATATDVDDQDEGPRPVGSGSTVKGRAFSSSAAPAADPDPQPVEGAVRIMEIAEKSGTTAATGRKWTRYTIIDSAGVEHHTFSKTISDDAARLRDAKTLVVIDEEATEDGQFSNIVQIQPAVIDADGM